MIIRRRALLQGLVCLPLLPAGCSREPQTPLAHLHGQGWVHGAYEMYASSYLDLQNQAEQKSHDAYGLLAQQGITSLDALQSREVPFHIRAAGEQFEIHRTVPERLMFSADMSEADRATATSAWKGAREHLHTDYSQIRRLNWALTTLLGQLQHVRSGVDAGQEEQYRLTRQLSELSDGTLPFALPFQVSQADYERVLYLLVERLEDDRHRLERVEADIVAVGLTARATDAGSGSLSSNIRKVLLAVVEDSAATTPREAAFPAAEDRHRELVGRGKELVAQIRASESYGRWLKQEKSRELQQVGSLLSILDQLTGLPASTMYRQVINLWSGEGDYLSYLESAVQLLPGGSSLSKVLSDASDVTRTARKTLQGLPTHASAPEGVGLLNTGSDFGRQRVARQLVFFRDTAEMETVSAALDATTLMRNKVRDVP